MRRWLAGALILVVLVGTLGALALVTLRGGPSLDGPRGTKPPESSAGAPRKAPDPELQEFYDQRLDWAPCDDSNECAQLTVPLSYAAPGGETVRIAVLKREADVSDARLGSLIVNPGGPGASGQQYADDAEVYFRTPLTDRYDFVGFDPRGVGESAPVDCLADDGLDALIASDPSPDDPVETRAFLRRMQDVGAGCARLSGSLIGHVSTIEAARDLDILRAALDESTLVYFGASYGTKLGATYAGLFPERVGRLVLDGAVDLQISSRELGLEQAKGFQTALDAYVQNCLATAPCFLGASLEAARTTVSDLLDTIDAEPLPAGGRTLAVGNAFYGIVAPLYNRDYWFLLTNGLQDALEGDGSALLQLSDAYTERDAGGGYRSNIMEANYAVNCLDDPTAATVAEVRAGLPDFERASPVFGDIFAWATLNCRGFPSRSAERVPDPRAAGAAPIVVVGTTRDPATPLRWARSLADQLASGVLVTRDGDGHTAYDSGNACVDEALEAYLISGTVPADGLTC